MVADDFGFCRQYSLYIGSDIEDLNLSFHETYFILVPLFYKPHQVF